MSWWGDQIAELSASPFVLGGLAAVATSILVSIKRNPKARFGARVVEALVCALLSHALTKAGVLYFAMSPDWAITIGVFVAFLGTDQLKTWLLAVCDFLVSKKTGKDSGTDSKSK